MPLPPDIISVSLFLCERTLQESNGILSAIRILDIFWVPGVPAEASNEKEKVPVIKMFGCALIKGKPGRHDHSIEFRVQNEGSDKFDNIGSPVILPVAQIPPGLEKFPAGGSINIELHVAVKTYGTSYLCLFLDGEEATRTPFTILPPQEPSKPVD